MNTRTTLHSAGQMGGAADGHAAADLRRPDGDVGGDRFGTSVALDGGRALIGAFGDDTRGTEVGQAHLFDAATGALLATLDDPTVTGADDFGFSVALEGDLVLIGAVGDDTQGPNVGQAHLFDATSGALLRTFDDPTVTSNDFFGSSVALHGNRVLIGARGDATQGGSVGQAHLFDSNSGALLQTFDDPTVTGGDEFGTSVALQGDRVLIGAWRDDTQGANVGQAHFFDATTGALLQTFDDPTVTAGDRFGISVALDGDRALIGAPFDDTHGTNVGQAHLFDTTTGNLLQSFDDPTVTGSDEFGTSVALQGDRVLIGASRRQHTGRRCRAGASVRRDHRRAARHPRRPDRDRCRQFWRLRRALRRPGADRCGRRRHAGDKCRAGVSVRDRSQ